MLANLLTNGLKYLTGKVQRKVQPRDEELLLAVTDHGPGIAAEGLPPVFGRFFRRTSKSTADGLGLGLYITKMAVEEHGGRIWIESGVGRGSIFSFTLPRS